MASKYTVSMIKCRAQNSAVRHGVSINEQKSIRVAKLEAAANPPPTPLTAAEMLAFEDAQALAEAEANSVTV